MSISPIRIPTTNEIEYACSTPIGSPIDDSVAWESVVYEVWNEYKVYKYILCQLRLLEMEVSYATFVGKKLEEKEFSEKRDMALQGVNSIRAYLVETPSFLERVAKRIKQLTRTTKEYRVAQKVQ